MEIKKKSVSGIVVLIFVVVSMRFFSLFNLPISNTSLTHITWIMAMLIYAFAFKGRSRIKPKYPYISKFFTYILVVQFILCVYSMLKYNETVKDMFLCVGLYFVLLITYAILLSFEKDEMIFLLDGIFWIMLIHTCLILIHAVVSNFTGIKLFKFVELTSKNANVRVGLGALMGIFFVYAFYNLINKRKTVLMSIAVVVGLFTLFYVDMTRGKEVAVIFSLFVVWIVNKTNSRKDLIKYIIAGVVLIVFLNSNAFSYILDAFSINPKVNADYQSTLARYDAMEYFGKFTKQNPLMGMGYVVPKTEELTKIWSGSSGRSFFDDLGFLGQFYRQGLLGASIYVILVVRMIFTTVKIKKGMKEKAFCAGLCSYVVLSAVSLNCFDAARILAVPFYIACTEYIYYKQKTDIPIIKKKKTDSLIKE